MARRPVLSLVLLLLPLILFGPLGIDIYLPAIPAMAQQFSASSGDIQMSLSVFILALGLGQLAFGPLVDNRGRRPVALAATLLFCLGALLTVLAQNLPMLLLGRLIQGLGACGCSVVVFAVVRDRLESSDSARAYCYLNGALCLAPALAPVLGAWLTIHLGWRANFGFLLAFSLLTLLLIMLCLQESRPAGTCRQPLFSACAYHSVWQQSVFRVYVVACIAAMGSVLTFVTLAPTVLMEQQQLDETGFALVFGSNAVLIMGASFSVPHLERLLGKHRMITLGALLLLLGGAGMALGMKMAPGVLTFMIPMGISSVGFSLILGAATASALAPFANRAGRAAALLGCLQMSGAALISHGAARLSWPPGEVCGLTIVVLATWALLTLTQHPRHRQQLADL